MPFWCVTSHSGQLSLLLSAAWEMNTNQTAVAVLCSWQGNPMSVVTLALNHRLWYFHLWVLMTTHLHFLWWIWHPVPFTVLASGRNWLWRAISGERCPILQESIGEWKSWVSMVDASAFSSLQWIDTVSSMTGKISWCGTPQRFVFGPGPASRKEGHLNQDWASFLSGSSPFVIRRLSFI